MPSFAAHLRFSCVLLITAVAVSAKAADCEPVPLFGPFPGAEVERCEKAQFAALDLQRWKDLEHRKGGVERFKVEGETWRSTEKLPKGPDGRKPGKLEVRRNFENAVLAGKGTILYVEEGGGRVFFKLVRDDGEWWGEAGCGGSLVDTHGIAAARLEAQGVGPLCPVRGNTGEAGRSRNRRVEMVLR